MTQLFLFFTLNENELKFFFVCRLSLIFILVQKMKAVEVKTVFKLRSQVNDLVMLKEQFTTK